jgi:hypothetical protein
MLAMIPLALDEIVAMVQFVRRRKREGQSAWHVFWYGDNLDHSEPVAPRREESWRPRGMLWGVTGNWPLAISAALGVWLMFAPDVLGSRGAMADSDHLVGALVIVVAVIALAEVARPARFLNIILGAWLLAAPWLLDGGSITARANSAIVGALAIILSLPLGRLRDHYGTYDRAATWGRRLVPARARTRSR